MKTQEVECGCLACHGMVYWSFELERKSGKNFLAIVESCLQDAVESPLGKFVDSYKVCGRPLNGSNNRSGELVAVELQVTFAKSSTFIESRHAISTQFSQPHK